MINKSKFIKSLSHGMPSFRKNVIDIAKIAMMLLGAFPAVFLIIKLASVFFPDPDSPTIAVWLPLGN